LWATGTINNDSAQLELTTTGDFVLFGELGEQLWRLGHANQGAAQAFVQNDGNLVIYGPTGAVWASNTAGNGEGSTPGVIRRPADDACHGCLLMGGSVILPVPAGAPGASLGNTWIRLSCSALPSSNTSIQPEARSAGRPSRSHPPAF
jgi:hypothetical protein